MQSYQLLHAVEKPMNLDYAKPFSNTSDLKHMTPKVHFSMAQKKEEAEEERAKAKLAANSTPGFTAPQEVSLEEDPLNRLFTNAREAEGKRASKADEKDERESQEFKLFY